MIVASGGEGTRFPKKFSIGMALSLRWEATEEGATRNVAVNINEQQTSAIPEVNHAWLTSG